MSEAPPLLRASPPAAGKVTLWIAFAALVVFVLLPQSTRYVQARDGRQRPMRWLQTPIKVQVAAPTPGVGLTAGDDLPQRSVPCPGAHSHGWPNSHRKSFGSARVRIGNRPVRIGRRPVRHSDTAKAMGS